MEHSNVADKLAIEVSAIGVDGLDSKRLVQLVRQEPSKLLVSNWQIQEDTKLKLNFQFEKEGQGYSFKSYEALLIGNLPVPHGVYGMIDTRELERKMESVDWTFSNPETEEADYNRADEVKDDIELLLKDKDGAEAAALLWNNNIPLFAIIKPKAIDDFENRSDLYPKKKFEAGTTVDVAFKELFESYTVKVEQLIEKRRRESPEPVDPALFNKAIIFNAEETAAIKAKFLKSVESGAIGAVLPSSNPVINEKDVFFFRDMDTAQHFTDASMRHDSNPVWVPSVEFKEKLEVWEKVINNQDELHRFIEYKAGQVQAYLDKDTLQMLSLEKDVELKRNFQLASLTYLLTQVTHKDRLEKINVSWDERFGQGNFEKPDFLKDCIPQMRQRDLLYPLNQVKKLGIEEALTPEVKRRMMAGEPEIHQPFSKVYFNKEKVDAVIHWKRSSGTNLYHLNQWDITVQSPLFEKPLTATFYKNTRERLLAVYKKPDYFFATFTFAQSKNYLLGRPVSANFENLKKQHFNGYGQLIYHKDGSSYDKIFRPHECPDLGKIATMYEKAIPRFANEVDRKELLGALRRGNAENVIFIEADGSKSRQWISLNMELKSLNIHKNYAIGEKHLSPKEQFDKKYISVEYFKELRATLNQVNKDKYGHNTKSTLQKATPEDDKPKDVGKKSKRQSQDSSTEKTAKKKKKTLKQ